MTPFDCSTTVIGAALQNYTYDLDGNLTDDGLWTYQWDAENRLIKQSTSAAATGAGVATRILTFVYDYSNRRVQKQVTDGNGTTLSNTRFIYDGWNLVAEVDVGSGNLIRSYTWGLDLAGSRTATGGIGALLRIYDHGGSGTAYLPSYDGNGNVASLVKASDGTLAAAYEYSPHGESLRTEGAYAAANPFRFSTKYQDTETGLLYYGNRYYSPALGRFVNRDPAEEAGGLNLSGFARNDSVNGLDVLGLGDGDQTYTLPPFVVNGYRPPATTFSFEGSISGGGGGAVHVPVSGVGGASLSPIVKYLPRKRTYMSSASTPNWTIIWGDGSTTFGGINPNSGSEVFGSDLVIVNGAQLKSSIIGGSGLAANIDEMLTEGSRLAANIDGMFSDGTIPYLSRGGEAAAAGQAWQMADSNIFTLPNHVTTDGTVVLGPFVVNASIPNNSGETVIIVTPGGNALPVPEVER